MEPRLDDPSLPFSAELRWDLAMQIAGQSSDLHRIADLDAYEVRSVPVESRKPFLQVKSSIRLRDRFTRMALPEMDRWIAQRTSQQGSQQPVQPAGQRD